MRVWLGALAGAAAMMVATMATAQPVGMIENAYRGQVAARMKAPLVKTDLFDDQAMRVVLCGTSAPFPDAMRAKSCTAVIVKGHAYLVDVGPGSVNGLMLMGFPMDHISSVFITHYHSDHIGDLGELRFNSWAGGRAAPLPVYGPEGIETVVAGFNQAYSLDDTYRTAHHGADVMPPAAANLKASTFALGTDGTKVVFQNSDVKITAFKVNHDPIRPAVGYRFDAGGRSVVVTGDTAPTPMIAQMAKGADILIAEALSMRMMKDIQEGAKGAGNIRQAKLMGDVQNYHIDPVDGAKAANEAGVKLLIYSHLAPNLPMPVLEKLFFDGVAAIRDPATWAVGFDGMRVDLPFAGGAAVSGKVTMPGRN
ncbi:MAG: MBL fold metallo-hydrolase [Caulobacteraceae bacterium]|nr:MBL fold metallo-hydrolase [Caulobacteraceae bacterium]